MRLRTILLILLLSLTGPGCALVHQGATVLTSKTCDAIEEHSEWKRNHKWAEAAWKHYHAAAASSLSDDFAAGFKEGFAQFLYEGGTGEPPPLPPRRYRKLRYQTPEGYQAIEDWFAGYRQGSTAANEGGYRRWVTGPTSLPAEHGPSALPEPQPKPEQPALSVPSWRVPFRVMPLQEGQDLPPPRQALPEEGQAPVETPVKISMTIRAHVIVAAAERGESKKIP